MNILIITTRFPPDTAIAAVRPYMFAKYLAKMGHHVTVLRSGEISSKPDHSMPIESIGVNVYSYLGENSPAERFRRGEAGSVAIGRSRIAFLPPKLRFPLARLYHKATSPLTLVKEWKLARSKFELQKKYLEKLHEEGEHFDAVFATYGGLENVYGGQYAVALFGCKLIMDFRDPIARREFYSYPEYVVLRGIQRNAIRKADISTAVSEALTEKLHADAPEKRVLTLHNGYDDAEHPTGSVEKHLIFCYTGQLYAGKQDASVLFKAVSELYSEGKLLLDTVRFVYAGNYYPHLHAQASRFGVAEILEDRGYLDRKSVEAIQSASDIFTVLSWNTRKAHGILTGKFYEGIRCARPILVLVSGDESDSELNAMCEKYHYGFCYEEANDAEDYAKLKAWILSAYQTKMRGEALPYTATQEFSVDFRYDTLARKLEGILSDLIK